jgi:hypothetical protein
MLRLTLALIAVLVFLHSASASLAPRQNLLESEKHIPAKFVKNAKPEEDQPELTITADTEIKLDDRPCKYADVPKDAEIILIDVSADKKVIRKLHFRSKK